MPVRPVRKVGQSTAHKEHPKPRGQLVSLIRNQRGCYKVNKVKKQVTRRTRRTFMISPSDIAKMEMILQMFHEQIKTEIRGGKRIRLVNSKIRLGTSVPWIHTFLTAIQNAPISMLLTSGNTTPPRSDNAITEPKRTLPIQPDLLPQDCPSLEPPEIKRSFEGVLRDFVRESRESLAIRLPEPTLPIKKTTAKKVTARKATTKRPLA